MECCILIIIYVVDYIYILLFILSLIKLPSTFLCIIATPVLDFIPIAEQLTFTRGQSQGDSVCANIMIIQDVFVETMETFEVMLLPDPNDILGAIIQPSKAKAIVTISDGEMDRSTSYVASSPGHSQLFNVQH